MIRSQQRLITAFLVSCDVLAVELALLLAWLLRFRSGLIELDHGMPPIRPYLLLTPAVALLWPAVFALQRLYKPRRGRSRFEELLGVGASVVLSLVLLFGGDAWLRTYTERGLPSAQQFQYSRAFVGLFGLFALGGGAVARVAARAAIAEARRRGYNARRILIVGAGRLGQSLARKMQEHAEYGYRVVGFLDDRVNEVDVGSDAGVLGSCDQVLDVVHKYGIDQVYLALPLSAHDRMLAVLGECSREGIEVRVVPDIMEYVALRAGLEELDGIPIINLGDLPLSGFGRFAKRAFDLSVSAILLVLLSPLLAGLAVAVKRNSRGSVLYRQLRMGLDGRPFTMYKFRTMVENAEAASGPVFAARGDARVTPLGRWLRQCSLDELPQLYNVLRGEMSLVGPRPERPHFVAEFKQKVPQYMWRHRVKSGMTGWAQVHGWRGNTSIPKRIEHDLYYIQNWSLALDIKILWLTLRSGLSHKNAY